MRERLLRLCQTFPRLHASYSNRSPIAGERHSFCHYKYLEQGAKGWRGVHKEFWLTRYILCVCVLKWARSVSRWNPYPRGYAAKRASTTKLSFAFMVCACRSRLRIFSKKLTLPFDPNFTPSINVAYIVETARDGIYGGGVGYRPQVTLRFGFLSTNNILFIT